MAGRRFGSQTGSGCEFAAVRMFETGPVREDHKGKPRLRGTRFGDQLCVPIVLNIEEPVRHLIA